MRVLVIEDDATTRQSIEMMLRKEQWVVDATHLGEDGLELAKLYEYDIIVLDLVLPDMDGLDIVRQLRAARIETPVLILSGLNEPDRKVRGLGSGADDYLTKPFNQTELVARIHAIVRRSKGHAQSVVSVGKMKIHLDAHTVTINDAPVHLTVKEYGILELLALRKGTTLAKEQFLSHLYNGIDEPELKIIDVFICKLRKKLADMSEGENYIDTVWGRGYVLRDPNASSSSSSGLPEVGSSKPESDPAHGRSDSTLPVS